MAILEHSSDLGNGFLRVVSAWNADAEQLKHALPWFAASQVLERLATEAHSGQQSNLLQIAALLPDGAQFNQPSCPSKLLQRIVDAVACGELLFVSPFTKPTIPDPQEVSTPLQAGLKQSPVVLQVMKGRDTIPFEGGRYRLLTQAQWQEIRTSNENFEVLPATLSKALLRRMAAKMSDRKVALEQAVGLLLTRFGAPDQANGLLLLRRAEEQSSGNVVKKATAVTPSQLAKQSQAASPPPAAQAANLIEESEQACVEVADLTVTVVDEAGKGIEGVTVALSGASSPSMPTDAAGSAAFGQVAAGDYNAQCTLSQELLKRFEEIEASAFSLAEGTSFGHTIVAISKPQIATVEWLDGDDATILAADAIQWVNLKREAKWVDATDVTTIDRLTHKPRVKVTFDKPGASEFKMKLVPDPGNLAYTAAEEGRNGKFKYETAEKTYTTQADGTKIVDAEMFLCVAGGHKYKLEAKDIFDNKKCSKTLETKRMVYYHQVKMTGLSAAASVATMTGEFATQGIMMKSAGDSTIIAMENIGTDADSTTFKTRVKAAVDGNATATAKKPNLIVVGYTDHLAVKDANQVITSAAVDVGPGKPDVEIPIVNGAGASKYLWQSIVTGESWFVSAKFRKTGGTAADDVVIDVAKCTADPISATRPSMSRKVIVDVTGLAADNGKITLTVNWVNRMRGGLSFPGTNLVCICTKAWWETKTEAAQNQVMIHEIGHQLSMVADGTGSGPDQVSTQYTGSGHVGSHCHNGVAAKADYSGDSASSTCVMFGATNGHTGFCANCAPAVKKQDLTNGFTPL